MAVIGRWRRTSRISWRWRETSWGGCTTPEPFRRCARPEPWMEDGARMSTATAKRPAIARIWRGVTPRDRADEYEAYNYEVGIKPLIEKALGVQTFREDRDEETEFMTISYW